MTEIPEHLLKRAQAARDKAAADEAAAAPAAFSRAACARLRRCSGISVMTESTSL